MISTVYGNCIVQLPISIESADNPVVLDCDLYDSLGSLRPWDTLDTLTKCYDASYSVNAWSSACFNLKGLRYSSVFGDQNGQNWTFYNKYDVCGGYHGPAVFQGPKLAFGVSGKLPAEHTITLAPGISLTAMNGNEDLVAIQFPPLPPDISGFLQWNPMKNEPGYTCSRPAQCFLYSTPRTTSARGALHVLGNPWDYFISSYNETTDYWPVGWPVEIPVHTVCTGAPLNCSLENSSSGSSVADMVMDCIILVPVTRTEISAQSQNGASRITALPISAFTRNFMHHSNLKTVQEFGDVLVNDVETVPALLSSKRIFVRDGYLNDGLAAISVRYKVTSLQPDHSQVVTGCVPYFMSESETIPLLLEQCVANVFNRLGVTCSYSQLKELIERMWPDDIITILQTKCSTEIDKAMLLTQYLVPDHMNLDFVSKIQSSSGADKWLLPGYEAQSRKGSEFTFYENVYKETFMQKCYLFADVHLNIQIPQEEQEHGYNIEILIPIRVTIQDE